MAEADPQFAEKLREALGPEIGPIERLEALARLSGGASHETWSFDAITDGASIPLILRRAPGGRGPSEEGGGSCALGTEAALLKVVSQTGAPVPEVVSVLGPEHGLGAGFVMRRIEGETIAPRILRDEAFAQIRPALAGQCGRILARIHSAPLDALGDLGLPAFSPQELVDRHREIYDRYDQPHPVFELAFRWLADRLPAAPRRALVHGDFRNGNFIVGPEGIRAVLDWELAHVGDPMEDLGWICVNSWRFGRVERPVGGFGDRADFHAAYEAEGGSVDRARIHFWEVFGTLKWGIACMTMLDAFRSGRDRTMERAAIGRRASETEIDLLRLIEEERQNAGSP